MFAQFIVALIFVIAASANAQAGWRSGGTVNVLLGVANGVGQNEVYGAVYSKTAGAQVYYNSDFTNIGSGIYRNGGNLNMDLALTNDGTTLCVTGPGGIVYGEAGSGWTSNAVAGVTNIVSQDVQAYGTSGCGFIGRFTHNSNNINGVVYSTDGQTISSSDIGLSVAAGYKARFGAFPTSTTWYVTSGDWPNNSDARLNNNVARVSGRISVVYDAGAGKPNVNFISTRNLQGNYPGAISKSTDGGATWTKVFDSNNKFYLNQISCFDANNCFAVGEDGKSATVIATTDGGANWSTKMTLRGPISLHAVAMVSATEIFVAGGSVSAGAAPKQNVGYYYRSTNGGASWTSDIFNGYGFDLSFKNGVGYAAALFKEHTDILTWF